MTLGNVQIPITVTDDDKVVKVTWSVDGVQKGSLEGADVKERVVIDLYNLTPGPHTLTINVTDSSGQVTTNTYNFFVDSQAPVLGGVTVNGTALDQGGNISVSANGSNTLTVNASDANGDARIQVFDGNTLVAAGVNSLTYTLPTNKTGIVNYRIVVTDSVGNRTERSFTVNYASTQVGEPAAPTPVIVINNTTPEPYSNVLSVTVSAGVAPGVRVEQLILQITDSKGIVDTTTYVSNSENATFSIDTTKYPDGPLKLKATAIDANGKQGVSAERTVQIANRVAPTITIVNPPNGSEVTGPTTIRVEVKQNNSDFAFDGQTVTIEIVDGRGQLLTSQPAILRQVNEGLWVAETEVDFNATQYLNADIIIRAFTSVRVGSDTATTRIQATSTVTNRSRTVQPPALNILMPAYFGSDLAKSVPVLNRMSAVALQISDSDDLRQVQIQLTCDTRVQANTCSNVNAFSANYPLGDAGIYYRVINLGPLLDGQPLVPDGRYVLRATATDDSGLSNIKEMDVKVDRSQEGIAGISYVGTEIGPDNVRFSPGEATWTLMGDADNNPSTPATTAIAANDVRVTTFVYDSNEEGLATELPSRIGIDTVVKAGQPITGTSLYFNAEGTYRVSYLVQDLKTGVVAYYRGGDVNVLAK
ncbi:hypothetical protein ACFP81_05170 [Deinococcus lacus]|uniref:Uncharacterized protein n=1 Tax=Deinococcus lacus TaxID=392561 RepID=A0ABW1YB76_9DEIO